MTRSPDHGIKRILQGGLFAAVCLSGHAAFAHVAFEDLDSGATFVAGELVELSWVDTIPHQTTAYHLDFIPTEGAQSVPIASDIPTTEHSFIWEVPQEPCTQCLLVVIQDNEGSDYSATLPIVIVEDASDLEDGAMPDEREASGMHLAPEPANTAELSENAMMPGADTAATDTAETNPVPSGAPEAEGAAEPAGSMQSWDQHDGTTAQACAAAPRSPASPAAPFAWMLLAVAGLLRRTKSS